MDAPFTAAAFEHELVENILPFWMTRAPDPQNGGFYGAINNRMEIVNSAERSAVLYGRILWTFARAYRRYANPDYLRTARYTLDYITRFLQDSSFGGVYWSVDAQGRAANPIKLTYAQAFAIYGLSEYYRATAEPASLAAAQEIYRLVEEHTFDPRYGAYFEGRAQDWSVIPDVRLSPRDLACDKSMNTLLHLIEAYTNLYLAWPDAELKARLESLVTAYLDHVVDPLSFHQKLFFSADWQSLSPNISYGHDIEASWLLVEAAQVAGNAALLRRAREIAVRMARTVYAEGRHPDGSLIYERTPGEVNLERHWWVQAEGVVGFYRAYRLTGDENLRQAAQACWNYIQAYLVDRENGDWFKVILPDGTPSERTYKLGPWECPYHHSRLCMEMIDSLQGE